MNQIESLLFARKIGKNGEALFSKHVDLVKALLSHSGSAFFTEELSEDYTKKFNNLKVYLSKVLSRKIKPSDEFIDSIQEVVREALGDSDEKTDLLKNLHQILTSPTSAVFVISDNDSHTEELNRRYGNSKTQITFISRPVETYDNRRATQFIDLILDSIFTLNGTIIKTDSDIHYEFHFAHPMVAHEFFDRLFNRVIERLGCSNSHSILQTIEACFEQVNVKILKLYCVDELFCTLPVTVFNHTSQDACGFVLFSHDASRFSIAKMSDAAINRWYKNMYLPAKFTRREITFEFHLSIKKTFGKKIDIADFNRVLFMQQ